MKMTRGMTTQLMQTILKERLGFTSTGQEGLLYDYDGYRDIMTSLYQYIFVALYTTRSGEIDSGKLEIFHGRHTTKHH